MGAVRPARARRRPGRPAPGRPQPSHPGSARMGAVWPGQPGRDTAQPARWVQPRSAQPARPGRRSPANRGGRSPTGASPPVRPARGVLQGSSRLSPWSAQRGSAQPTQAGPPPSTRDSAPSDPVEAEFDGVMAEAAVEAEEALIALAARDATTTSILLRRLQADFENLQASGMAATANRSLLEQIDRGRGDPGRAASRCSTRPIPGLGSITPAGAAVTPAPAALQTAAP